MRDYQAWAFQKLKGDQVILTESHDAYLNRHRKPSPIRAFNEYGTSGWTPRKTETVPLEQVQKDYKDITQQIAEQTSKGPKPKTKKTGERSWAITNYSQWNSHFTHQLRPLMQTQKALERILKDAKVAA